MKSKHANSDADSLDLTDESYPFIRTVPVGMVYDTVVVPRDTRPPEFILVPIRKEHTSDFIGFVMEWNILWETGHLRPRYFAERPINKSYPGIPSELRWLANIEDRDIHLIPVGSSHKFEVYNPIYRLLPLDILKKFGLPVVESGIWPVSHRLFQSSERVLPPQFLSRLESAFSYHIWPLLNPGKRPTDYSKDEPLCILSHNLDFWLPHVTSLIQDRLSQSGRYDPEGVANTARYKKARARNHPAYTVEIPLAGSELWYGKKEAWEATKATFELADSNGSLRAIVEAVRSNRIQDDFSDKWSREREDFERKLYKKRSRKLKVSFVELDRAIPVHSPDSEIHEDLLWGDFLALLDEKERSITILLRKGQTNLTEIAQQLGYANHSPISKRLNQIRKKAASFLAD